MTVHGLEALVGWCKETNAEVDPLDSSAPEAFFGVQWAGYGNDPWDVTVWLAGNQVHPAPFGSSDQNGRQWIRASGATLARAVSNMMRKLKEVTERDESTDGESAETG